jgi:inhibitor of KinA
VHLANTYQIYPVSDHAIMLDFGQEMNAQTNQRIMLLFQLLQEKNIAGVKDIIPAYSSLCLVYDCKLVLKAAGGISAYDFLKRLLDSFVMEVGNNPGSNAGRNLKLPVCYDPILAPDLMPVIETLQLGIEEFIALHSNTSYRVYMIGFLPGFAYMGTINEKIISPRKQNPRTIVPAGSVGIAGAQTGVYPFASPGGWQLIGRTPIQIFDTSKKQPSFFLPGDTVCFEPIAIEQFYEMQNQASKWG